MPAKQTAVFGLGVLALLIALAVPAAIHVVENPSTSTYDIDEGGQRNVIQTLEVVLQDATQTDATITVRDGETLESQTQTLSENETREYVLNNQSINVTLRSVSGSNANATVAVEYPRTYGWDSGAKTFVDNLPFMLVLALGLVVVGAAGALKP